MRSLVAALTLACCSLVAGSAMPKPVGPDYVKLKALLPAGPDAALCFARAYDAEHLRKHPQQEVTELILFIRYITLDEDEATLVATDDGGTMKQYFDYDFTLAAKVKGRSETLYASGDCASAEGIGCGVDCDGGGIALEPIAGNPDELVVRLERIRMTLGCGEGEEVELEGGADDKVFKLAKAPRLICEAMQKAREAIAMTEDLQSALMLHHSDEEAVSAVAQGRHEKGVLRAIGRKERRRG